MADKSIQEKQRRRQKAVKDPVCASRVIKNPLYGTGWSGKLSAEEKNLATSLLDDAAAMYSLQINRDREVEPLSLHNAVFWEHRQLSDPTMVSTPALIWKQQQQLNELNVTTGIVHAVPFFALNKESWKDSLRQVLKQSTASSDLEIHHLFANIRDREFTIWPALVDGFWVTIIMRVEVLDTPEFIQGPTSNFYFDRKVDKLAIIDPVLEESEERRDLVFKRLRNLLRQGCVSLPEESLINTLKSDQVESDWETGYISYAISREFLRRLKVLTHRRQREASGEPDSDSERELLWTPFEETPSIDGYREALMSACSNYVITLSGYRIRSALEVPSTAAGHSAESLQPDRAASENNEAVDEKINIGDQTRRFVLQMDLPEGYDKIEASVGSRPDIDLEEDEVEKQEGPGEEQAEETESRSSSESEEDSTDIDEKAPKEEVQRARLNALGILPSIEDATDEKPSEAPEKVSPQLPAPSPPEPQKIQAPPSTGTPEPQTEVQEPYYKPPAFSIDPTAELESKIEEERLRTIAAAAQGLADAAEASKLSPGEAITITSEVVLTPRAGTPPTQQEIDSQQGYPEPTIASMLNEEVEKLEDTPNSPPQAPQQIPEADVSGDNATSTNELPVYPSTPEQGAETETKVPEATMVDADENGEPIIPNDASEAPPEVRAKAASVSDDNEAGGDTGAEKKETETDEIPIKADGDITDNHPKDVTVATKAGDLPTYTVGGSAAAAAATAAESEGDANKEDQEYDSIFGNGESPSGESDIFIPEDDETEAPSDEGTTTAKGEVEQVSGDEKDAGGADEVSARSASVPVDAEQEVLPPPPPAGSPAPSPAPAPAPTPSGSSNNPIAIPGLSVAANTFSWSPLGKREAEGGDGTGEETSQPSPKRQRLLEEQ